MTVRDPLAVRVWVGYRHQSFMSHRHQFDENLANIFIPVTWQWMAPLGCQAYIPSLLVDTQCNAPDEIALVFYVSQKAYFHITQLTTTGRAYASLHQTQFNFQRNKSGLPFSWSSFPILLEQNKVELKFDQAYALSLKVINWQTETVRVFSAQRKQNISKNEWKKLVALWLHEIRQKNSNLVGYFLLSQNYFCFWYIKKSLSHSELPPITCYEKKLVDDLAINTEVFSAFSQKNSSVSIKQGQSLNLHYAKEII